MAKPNPQKTPLAVAGSNLPALANMYEEDAGGGFEGADRDAFAIPFLGILQALSPQLNRQDGAYIKGAEQGMIFNSATSEVFSGEDGVVAIPCYYQRTFTHWGPRDAGGGFLGEVSPADEVLTQTVKNAKGALELPDKTYFRDTRSHYVLVVMPDGSFQHAVIPMGSTQIKKSRQWMTKMQNIKVKRANGSLFTPPMFSHTFRLTTVPESNAQGSWYGWKIETIGPIEDADLYQAAKSFRDAISAGEVKKQTPDATPEIDAEEF